MSLYPADACLPISALIFASTGLTAQMTGTDESLVSDAAMRLYIVIGCTLGGIVSLSISPGKSPLDSVSKWAVSGIFGFFTTILLFEHMNWDKSHTDSVTGCAFLTSMFSWMVIAFFKGKRIEDLYKMWKSKSISTDE